MELREDREAAPSEVVLVSRILLTGATGFIGKALLSALLSNPKLNVSVVVRRSGIEPHRQLNIFSVNDLFSRSTLAGALVDVRTIIHTAARVHVMNETTTDSLAEFRRVNFDGTLNLARQAEASGVKRFIFISSIKVNGEGTALGSPYTADDHPNPRDPYGVSKLEAEQGLLSLAAETGMEVVIIRSVLVYGPGVKANFQSMMRWLNRGIPLPLGAIHNKRSLVSLDNLVSLIVTCIEHPAAANQVFLVSDGEDLSTTELLQRMGRALGKPARLLPVPASMLDFGARVLGKASFAQRLCGSLQVDIRKTRDLLNWTPPVSVDDALSETARHFLEHQAK